MAWPFLQIHTVIGRRTHLHEVTCRNCELARKLSGVGVYTLLTLTKGISIPPAKNQCNLECT